jgi:hypothetical protein
MKDDFKEEDDPKEDCGGAKRFPIPIFSFISLIFKKNIMSEFKKNNFVDLFMFVFLRY